MRTLPLRSLIATALVVVLVLPATAPLAQSEDAGATGPIEVPGIGEVSGLEDLLELPGLDLADPILGPVSGIIDTLAGLVDDVLGQVPLPNILALQGEDAIDAAVAFSQATFASSDTAVLARDDVFADALTTGVLQGVFDAPLLLTDPGDLDRRTATELVRLGVQRMVIVGGEDAVSPLVLQKIALAGIDVTRVGGPTRIETAADTAAATAPDATTAVLTRAYSSSGDDSQAYADLLAVSPWAAENSWPVLLTQSEVLTGTTRDHIDTSSLTEIIIIGGTGAVSQAVEDALVDMGLTVRRVAGATRFGTAVAIAEQRGYADSSHADRLILAEGGSSRNDVWAPGFAAAAHAARNGAPVLLADGPTIPPETMAFITEGMADNLVDGGPATLCASFVNPIACQAAGLLLLGQISDALDLLGLELLALPDLLGLLADLGLGDLADLLDGLDGAVDGLLDEALVGDVQALLAALQDSDVDLDGVTGLVAGLEEGLADLGDILDPITDPLDPITDPLDPITDPLDPILDPIDDVLDPILGGGG